MSDAKGANNDPSMDDILASIRKIISDDEARAQVSGSAAAPSTGPANGEAAPPPRRDDVLLLTDLVDEPKTPPPRASARPVAMPPRRINPVSASEMPQPSIAPAPPPLAATSPGLSAEPAVKKPSSEPNLVEAGAAGVAASAFDRLSQAVQDSVPAPMAHDPGPTVGSSGRSLEDIVKEMLRPMLKEWLDRNLPSMVERFVEREIVRLTRR
ncbi:MAG TPA: DUF2497 domain-containing protein [Reyranella sp.]|nr:DUF2497 domain-containing protein [Reyranella sp.]